MRFQNRFTGEIYTSVWDMISGVVSAVIYFKACRTVKILDIRVYK